MSAKKNQEVDPAHSSSNRRKHSRVFDNISCSSNVSTRWTSVFSCCLRQNRGEPANLTLREFNPNDFDYIVEKLVVKRVPLSLYATEEDFQDYIDEKNHKETPHGPFANAAMKEMRDRQVYSTISGVSSALHFFKNKTPGDLLIKQSNKNLRFNKDRDILDEDAAEAGPSSYVNARYDIQSLRMRDEEEAKNEYLNQFSALHPDLKESERPVKDPNPLNPPRSTRSLAEDLSEIASMKKNMNMKSKNGRRTGKHDSNVYVTVSGTSKELSTRVLDDEEIIPARSDNKFTAKHTSIYRKMGITSCLPYSQKTPKGHAAGSEKSKLMYKESAVTSSKNGNFPEKSQPRTEHYATPDKPEIAKVNDNKTNLSAESDASFRTESQNYPDPLSKLADEEYTTDATSYTSDDLKNANSAGTTLRWKIIIKHHKPSTSSPETGGTTSDFSKAAATIVPALNDE